MSRLFRPAPACPPPESLCHRQRSLVQSSGSRGASRVVEMDPEAGPGDQPVLPGKDHPSRGRGPGPEATDLRTQIRTGKRDPLIRAPPKEGTGRPGPRDTSPDGRSIRLSPPSSRPTNFPPTETAVRAVRCPLPRMGLPRPPRSWKSRCVLSGSARSASRSQGASSEFRSGTGSS